MTFIGKFENLDIHLIENKGITLIDTELNQYEFYCNDPILNQLDYLETKIKSLWGNPTFQERNGSGINVTSRVPYIIPLGEQILKP